MKTMYKNLVFFNVLHYDKSVWNSKINSAIIAS